MNINTLKTGDIFGELAMKLENQKRTATIITKLDTDFGYSNREIYSRTLSDDKIKLICNEISSLLQYSIFRNYTRVKFYKEIYPILDKIYFKRYQYIFRENDFFENVIFLNEGEYCLKIRKNFIDINLLIKKLGGTPEGEYEENNEMFDNEEFKKFMENKQELKVKNKSK
jgi:hypothetical protein